MSLAEQRVVVVGGTSGMGAATVRASRRLGAEVVSAGRRPVGERDGVDGVHEVVDGTDEASVRALFESVGELDHLLVMALPGQSGVLLEQDHALARTFMDGKFFGSWTGARWWALGVMSVTWVVRCRRRHRRQKLLPPKAAIDVPLTLVGPGILIILAPSSVPGLT
jgi:NAD(P)-dependent dehydrogenase (short-subunit alcohol dehydrogenase family)